MDSRIAGTAWAFENHETTWLLNWQCIPVFMTLRNGLAQLMVDALVKR